jgi:hypothetical protein
MSVSSHSYKKMVLSHLEQVEQLPTEVQADILLRSGWSIPTAGQRGKVRSGTSGPGGHPRW